MINGITNVLGTGVEFNLVKITEEWFPSSGGKCDGVTDASRMEEGCWIDYDEPDLGKYWFVEIAAHTWQVPDGKLNVPAFVANAKVKATKLNISSMLGFAGKQSKVNFISNLSYQFQIADLVLHLQ